MSEHEQSPDITETFFGLTKMKALLVFSLLALIAVNFVLVAIVLGLRANTEDVNRNETAITLNKKALRYICSTTGVLDALVVAAADQLDLNLRNGTYERLVARGILTEANVRAARLTRDKYKQAHSTLQHNISCKIVSGH